MPLVSQIELVKKAMADQVVSFPTDTVPALAVSPQKSNLIFQLKQRQPDKPLILMGGDLSQLWEYVKGTSQQIQIWQHVANQYLPGALTLVLPASAKVPKAINPLNPDSIGIRVPNLNQAREILRQTGVLATTSANFSGQESLTDMKEIAQQFPSVYVLDCQNKLQQKQKTPSTVIKWINNDWQILRQGMINFP